MNVTMKDYIDSEYMIYPPWWRKNDMGVSMAAIETQHGIVYAEIFSYDDYTKLCFVHNGRTHTRSWNRSWGRKTAVRLAREMADDIVSRD